MHHLSDEEFRAAREDVLGGLVDYYQNYFAYARIYRGMAKLDIPLEDMPDEWKPFLDVSGRSPHVLETMDALLRLETLLKEIQNEDPSPEVFLANLQRMAQLLTDLRIEDGLPPQPDRVAIHSHYCPLCEAVFPCPCFDGPDVCIQPQEMWCDSCRVKQESME